MSTEINQINELNAMPSSRARVMTALKKASAATGVDFSYLLAKATQESGLDAAAKAKGSSATGLFQFIDQTWLKTVKEHGAEHGLGAVADKITIDGKGRAHIANAAEEEAVLALRTNPEVASIMAAELAQDNKESLERAQVGEVGATELYLAHFLGAGGAKSFLKAAQASPQTKAADLLPQAAAANRSVFFDAETGRAKTVAEVYSFFDGKFGNTAGSIGGEQRFYAARETGQTFASGVSLPLFSTTASTVSFGQEFSSSGTAKSVLACTSVSGNKIEQTPLSTLLLAQMDMDLYGVDAISAANAFRAYGDERKRLIS